ncbi:MAG: adenine phosphoribosyltransferase [Bdellovibrionales bacterium]
MDLKSKIHNVADFPKPGILFRDVTPLLKDPEALHFIAENLVKHVDLKNVDYFAGVESRGFIFASLLASHHKKGFLPIRKAGKLPPPVIKIDYDLEYGQASLELAPGRGNIVILDDVLATGGTLSAAIKLAQMAGYRVEDVAVLIDLPFLNQMRFKDRSIKSLVQY